MSNIFRVIIPPHLFWKYAHDSGSCTDTFFDPLPLPDLLYRYAGDEFLILSALEPEQIQERLNEILEKSPIHFDINGESRNISFSYGIVAFEEKKGKIADLVKEADQRMYQCKDRKSVV